ncbi:MAG: sialidase family protein, partial [Tannerellaceae bacterium]
GTTKRSDIDKIYLVREGKEKQILAEAHVNKSSLYLPITTQLSDTTNMSVYCDLKPQTPLLHRIDVQCKEIKTDKGMIRPTDETIKGQRVGVAVQDAGTENVAAFRIPGLATTKNGSLIAVYDARRESSRDLQGHMDIGVSRSTDNGQTWEPMRVALDMKTWGGLPEKFNGVSDACVLADPNTGTIWVAGLWMHGILDKDGKWIEGLNEESKNWQHQWAGRGSQPGLTPKETCQFIISRSDDDGKTWSEPVNITEQTKRSEWWLYAPAPGQGIVMTDGTLVFPTQGRDKEGMPFSNITYSKDGGKTWTTSNPSYTNTTECAVVQLNDGSLMLNMRDNRNGAEKG